MPKPVSWPRLPKPGSGKKSGRRLPKFGTKPGLRWKLPKSGVDWVCAGYYGFSFYLCSLEAMAQLCTVHVLGSRPTSQLRLLFLILLFCGVLLGSWLNRGGNCRSLGRSPGPRSPSLGRNQGKNCLSPGRSPGPGRITEGRAEAWAKIVEARSPRENSRSPGRSPALLMA